MSIWLITYNIYISFYFSKEDIKRAKNGMVINGKEFKSQSISTLFRSQLEPFDNNSWFISLQGNQLEAVVNGEPHFGKLYEYSRKLKDALELDDNVIVSFKPTRILTDAQFKLFAEEVIEHDKAYQTIARSNGTEFHELLDDYDDSDL